MSTRASWTEVGAPAHGGAGAGKQVATLLTVLVPFLGLFPTMGLLWGVAFGPLDLVLLLSLYVLTALGISLGFHRLFSHRSFRAKKGFEVGIAILGAMAVQGPLTEWVVFHRKHHALADREGDPHSPHVGRSDALGSRAAGLWHAHIGWFFTRGSWFFSRGRERELPQYGRDLYANELVMRIDRLYPIWMTLSLALPFGIGLAVGGTLARGFEAMIWGGLLRIFLLHHVTWSVNSICHSFGRRMYRATDESRNNWVLALPSLGEAWHNNHHAFPSAAIYGLDRFQIDIAGIVLLGLERVGLVSDLKRPDQSQRTRRRLRTTA